MPVGSWRFAAFDALQKMLAFDTQRLGHIKLRRPHVAAPVTHSKVMYLLRVIGETNAAIVDLDLFGWLHVVVHDHFLAAPQQYLTHLDRGEPIDVRMADGAGFVE